MSLILLLMCLPFVVSTCVNQAVCGAGCWKVNGTCTAVGLGYFSSADSNTRLPCAPGFYSDVIEAATCLPCQPGALSGLFASSNCFLCPPGYYSATYGQSYCRACETSLYAGHGSNSADAANRCQLVLETNAPTRSPFTTTLSHIPTFSPIPLVTRSPTHPTLVPTFTSAGPTTVASSPLSPPPTRVPTNVPTPVPTKEPTSDPTKAPIRNPTATPTSDNPTEDPTWNPTIEPLSTPFSTTQPTTPFMSSVPSSVSAITIMSESPFMAILMTESSAPSITFTTGPSDEVMVAVPSSLPSETPSTSARPSLSLDDNITTVEMKETIGFYESTECSQATLVLHGECHQCPTNGRFWILQLGFLSILLFLAVLFQVCCAGAILAGFDFLFALSMFRLTSVPWSKPIERIFLLTSIASLDLNVILPLSCFPKIDSATARAIILVVPFILWFPHGGVIPTIHGIGFLHPDKRYWICNRMGQWYMLALLLTFPYLALTALEAAECEDLGWFCLPNGTSHDKGIMGLCIAAATFLAGSIPFLFARMRITGIGEDILFRPYRLWWWHFVVLTRKLVMVGLVYFLVDWSMLGILAISLIHLGLYVFVLPYAASGESPALKDLLGNQCLDVLLQCLAISIGVLGLAMKRFPKSERICSYFVFVGIGIGFLWWICVVVKHVCCAVISTLRKGKHESGTHETNSLDDVEGGSIVSIPPILDERKEEISATIRAEDCKWLDSL